MRSRRLPPHATAAGLVLLAHADGAVQKEIGAGPLRACTPATLGTIVAAAAMIQRCVRGEGLWIAEVGA